MKLFISVYNRPEYLEKSLDSLGSSFSAIYPEIVITDDGSTDIKTIDKINGFELSYPGKVRIVHNSKNKGIPYGKLDTIYKEIYDWDYPEPYFFISDSDMIYKKGWMEYLIFLYEQTQAPLVTGFNTITNKHKIIKIENLYYVKDSIGGCNILVDTAFYMEHPFRAPKEWDFRMCEDANAKHTPGVICSRPSVVDHIGVRGFWARDNYHDKAIDF